MSKLKFLAVFFVCLLLVDSSLIVSAQSRGGEGILQEISKPEFSGECAFVPGVELDVEPQCNNVDLQNVLRDESGRVIEMTITYLREGASCRLGENILTVAKKNKILYRDNALIVSDEENFDSCLNQFENVQNKLKFDQLLALALGAVKEGDKESGELAKKLYEELGGKEKFLENLEKMLAYYDNFIQENVNEGKLPEHMLKYFEEYKELLLSLSEKPQYIGLTREETIALHKKELDAKDSLLKAEYDKIVGEFGQYSEEAENGREEIYGDDKILQDLLKQKEKDEFALQEVEKLPEEQQELFETLKGERFSELIWLNSLIAQRKNKLTGEKTPEIYNLDIINLRKQIDEKAPWRKYGILGAIGNFLTAVGTPKLNDEINNLDKELAEKSRLWQDSLDLSRKSYNPLTGGFESVGSVPTVEAVDPTPFLGDILLIAGSGGSSIFITRGLASAGTRIGLLKMASKGLVPTTTRFITSTAITSTSFHISHNLLKEGLGAELSDEDWSSESYTETFLTFLFLGGVGKGLGKFGRVPAYVELPVEVAAFTSIGAVGNYFGNNFETPENYGDFLAGEAVHNLMFFGGLKLSRRFTSSDPVLAGEYNNVLEKENSFREKLKEVRGSNAFKDRLTTNGEVLSRNLELARLGRESLEARAKYFETLRKSGKITEEIYDDYALNINKNLEIVKRAETKAKNYKSFGEKVKQLLKDERGAIFPEPAKTPDELRRSSFLESKEKIAETFASVEMNTRLNDIVDLGTKKVREIKKSKNIDKKEMIQLDDQVRKKVRLQMWQIIRENVLRDTSKLTERERSLVDFLFKGTGGDIVKESKAFAKNYIKEGGTPEEYVDISQRSEKAIDAARISIQLNYISRGGDVKPNRDSTKLDLPHDAKGATYSLKQIRIPLLELNFPENFISKVDKLKPKRGFQPKILPKVIAENSIVGKIEIEGFENILYNRLHFSNDFVIQNSLRSDKMGEDNIYWMKGLVVKSGEIFVPVIFMGTGEGSHILVAKNRKPNFEYNEVFGYQMQFLRKSDGNFELLGIQMSAGSILPEQLVRQREALSIREIFISRTDIFNANKAFLESFDGRFFKEGKELIIDVPEELVPI